jgi:hypothetical protein
MGIRRCSYLVLVWEPIHGEANLSPILRSGRAERCAVRVGKVCQFCPRAPMKRIMGFFQGVTFIHFPIAIHRPRYEFL